VNVLSGFVEVALRAKMTSTAGMEGLAANYKDRIISYGTESCDET